MEDDGQRDREGDVNFPPPSCWSNSTRVVQACVLRGGRTRAVKSPRAEREERKREIARAVAIVPGVQHASFDKILYRPREALNRENCIQ